MSQVFSNMDSLLLSLKQISLAADIFQQHTRVQLYLLDFKCHSTLASSTQMCLIYRIKGITDDLLMFHSSSAQDWMEGSVGLCDCDFAVCVLGVESSGLAIPYFWLVLLQFSLFVRITADRRMHKYVVTFVGGVTISPELSQISGTSMSSVI